jgi:hypothetical protein
MNLRKTIVALLAALAVAALTTSSALAGEITGNGKPTGAPAHSNSECSFSGLDDPDPDPFGRTQNWGQLSKEQRAFLESIGQTPWQACNGHLSPRK